MIRDEWFIITWLLIRRRIENRMGEEYRGLWDYSVPITLCLYFQILWKYYFNNDQSVNTLVSHIFKNPFKAWNVYKLQAATRSEQIFSYSQINWNISYILILPIGTICTNCILHIHRPIHQPLYHTIFNQFCCEFSRHIHNQICQLLHIHSQLY